MFRRHAHVTKDRIAAVVAEGVDGHQAEPLLAMKKGEAAATATRLLEGKGWVRKLLGSRSAMDPKPLEDEGGTGK